MSDNTLARIQEIVGSVSATGTPDKKSSPALNLVELAKEAGIYIRPGSSGWHHVSCPFAENHTTGTDGDSSTSIYQDEETGNVGFKCQHSHCADKNLGALLEALPEELVSKYHPRHSSTSGKRRGLELLSLKAVFELPEEEYRWAVDGLLISGGTSIFGAKPKVGKTTMARQLALAVATGKPFLGRKTRQGPVLYLALEEKRAELKSRLKDLGATGEEPVFIHAAPAPQDLADELRAAVQRLTPVLVIIDTLIKAISVEDGNDYAQMTQALRFAEEIARETGVHIMLVHHLNKSEREGTDSLLGSQAISGSCDTIMLLTRDKDGNRTVETRQRYGDDLEKTRLIFDNATRAVILGTSAEQAETATLEQEIINVLQRTPGIPMESIVKGVEAAAPRTREAVREMETAGLVVGHGRGKKGDPRLYALTRELDGSSEMSPV